MRKRWMFLTCLCLTMTGTIMGEEIKPILSLSFDDKTAPAVDIAGGHELLPVAQNATPTWIADGKFGGALEFDGTDDVLAFKDAIDLNFGPDDSFTVEAWVCPDPKGDAAIGSIVRKGGGTNWDLRCFTKCRLSVFFNENGHYLEDEVLMDRSKPAGKWRHVAFVKDADEKKTRLYVDGLLIKEKDLPLSNDMFTQPGFNLLIGDSNGHPFRGKLDELVIFKGAKRTFDLAKPPTAGREIRAVADYQPAKPVIETPDPMVAASWAELDKYHLNIVPSPKSLKVTGEAMAITPDDWKIVTVGASLKAGVDLFNQRMELAGGRPLPTTSSPKSDLNLIIAGTFDDLKAYLPKIGNPEKPPRQGYVIGCFTENGKQRVVAAGTDVAGTRYALVTLALALKKNDAGPRLYPMRVRDWPDFTYRMPNFCIIPGRFDFESTKKMIDRAFTLKYNMLQGSSMYTTIADLIKNESKVKKYFEYANQRGIRLMIQNHTAVIENIPKFDPKTMPGYSQIYYPYKTEEGLLADSHYGPGRAFTWCRDDLIEQRGQQIDELLTKVNGDTVFLHSMDCGGVDNPGNWSKRTPMDKKRWGDDRAAAEANLWNILYENMVENHPDLILVVVEYPYGAMYLKNASIIRWLKRLNELLNPNVYFCIRECDRSDLTKWLEPTGDRPYFIGYEPYPVRLQPLFCCMPRYARTFYYKNRPNDVYWLFANSTLKRNFENLALVNAEYAWNTEAPGWGWFPADAKSITRIDEYVPQINEILLPRALAIFYGEQAAPHIAKALSSCVSANIAVNQRGFKGASFESYFKAKSKAAKEAAANMNKAAPLVTGDEKDEFILLHKVIKAAAVLNQVKDMQLTARSELADGDVDEAERTIQKARTLLENAELPAQFRKRWVPPLLKELDVAKNIGWYRNKKKYLDGVTEMPIRVGLYNYGWHKGIVYSLSHVAGMTTGVFEDPQPDYLNDFDVVIFNACKNTGDVYGDWRKAVRDYVENGGVAIFTHNAIGRHPSSSFGKQIFPEICSAYGGQQMKEPELTVKKEIDGGAFKPGDTYVHGYFDHLMPVPGNDAEIFLVNKFGKPVMVGGKVGKGYVVYTGEIFGLDKCDNDADLTEDNWKMLFHIIREAKTQCEDNGKKGE